MENLDPQSEQIKKVYALFGLAMYLAQCCEKGAATLLMTHKMPDMKKKKVTRRKAESLIQALFRKTFGSLKRELMEAGVSVAKIESDLTLALEKRNWLAHNYFWERAGHFMTEKGREKMILKIVR